MSTNTPIASQTLGSAAATVIFTDIPQTYTDLVLVISGANTGSDAANTGYMQYNSDTGNNYSDTVLYTNGNTPATFRTTNSNSNGLWTIMGNTDTNRKSTIVVQFQNYSNTTTYKTTLNRIGTPTSSGGWTNASVGLWRNNSAITSILVGGGTNWLAGSTFNLYGIAAGSLKAQGGLVTTDGTYWYHTFNSSGVFSVNQNITADFLVIGGGGSGGIGGGGGAGGYRTSVGTSGGGSSAESALSLTAGSNYTAVIGAGGPSITNASAGYPYGYSGTSSYFSTITSVGGGYGGGSSDEYNNRFGGNGGSGGGGGYNAGSGKGNGGSPTSNQGYAGGSTVLTLGSGSQANYASGGGGAGAAGGGVTSSSSVSGNGGNGITSSISGTSVARGGGGGGATANSNTGCGTGGTGGGGNALTASNAGNGTANTGGGGGGQGGQLNVNYTSGAGGSGVVIVRYAV